MSFGHSKRNILGLSRFLKTSRAQRRGWLEILGSTCEHCDWWMTIKRYSVLTVEATVIKCVPLPKRYSSNFKFLSYNFWCFFVARNKCEFSLLWRSKSNLCHCWESFDGYGGTLTRIQWTAKFSIILISDTFRLSVCFIQRALKVCLFGP